MRRGYGIASATNRWRCSPHTRVPQAPALMALQHCQSDPRHDEMLFIIVHQAYELWFKLILHEIDGTAALIDRATALGTRAGAARSARPLRTFYVRRIVAIERLLVDQIHIVETIVAQDFLGFRSDPNPASGFQSSQFREIEQSPAASATIAASSSTSRATSPRRWRWAAALARPSLQDRRHALLRAHGYDLPMPPARRPPRASAPPRNGVCARWPTCSTTTRATTRSPSPRCCWSSTSG